MTEYFSLESARDRLADALVAAADTHGLPNSFGVLELAREYGGPKPVLAGRLGRRFLRSLTSAIGARLPGRWRLLYVPPAPGEAAAFVFDQVEPPQPLAAE